MIFARSPLSTCPSMRRRRARLLRLLIIRWFTRAWFAAYKEHLSPRPDENILPLRILLAKNLLERNGGRFAIDSSEDDRETVRMEFPIAEHR